MLAYAAFGITRFIINRGLTDMVARTATQLDDILLGRSFFHRLSYLVPVGVLYNFAYLLPNYGSQARRLLVAVITVILILSLGAALTSLSDYLQRSESTRRFGAKSYTQVAKLVLYLFGSLIAVAILLGRSPWVLLSGFGAMTAVLLLVFRDTILSFVASLQISSNDLVQVGDWIEMPAFGADGDVFEIALHTIKVRNWDMTITTIPTYKLMEGSFKNWRGMNLSGGRRIKRAIHIDMSTIRLCDEEDLNRYEQVELLKDYIQAKRAEVLSYNADKNVADDDLINGRRLTNIGTFRAYIRAYLRSHPDIHQDMTLLVRQRAPGPNGLPVEVYVFTNNIEWSAYENIQSDIFDHLLAVAPEFGLRVFQSPTGADFQRL